MNSLGPSAFRYWGLLDAGKKMRAESQSVSMASDSEDELKQDSNHIVVGLPPHGDLTPTGQMGASPDAQSPRTSVGEDAVEEISTPAVQAAKAGRDITTSDDEQPQASMPKVLKKSLLQASVVGGSRRTTRGSRTSAESPVRSARRRCSQKTSPLVTTSKAIKSGSSSTKVNPEDSIPCLMCGKSVQVLARM